jgi:hypothetical protein
MRAPGLRHPQLQPPVCDSIRSCDWLLHFGRQNDLDTEACRLRRELRIEHDSRSARDVVNIGQTDAVMPARRLGIKIFDGNEEILRPAASSEF